jgi:hypothetical protein
VSECSPNCEGLECGDDSCGGTCGTCPEAAPICEEGKCQLTPACEPDCAEKECGNDGCGGTCGACEEGTSCMEGGQCSESECEPDCGEKSCGDDGCGGSCGECGEGFVCQANPPIGTDCVCAPQCEGKECGDDGCGGSCGSCEAGICEDSLCIEYVCGPELTPCQCAITKCGGFTDTPFGDDVCDVLSPGGGPCGDALAEAIQEQGCPALCSDSVPEILSGLGPVMKTLCSLDECAQAIVPLSGFGFNCSSCFESME